MKTVMKFLRDERAAAVGIAAGMAALMTFGAAALLVDHLRFVAHRDVLKAAADAAALSARLEWAKLPRSTPDAQVLTTLDTASTKYAVANVLPNLVALSIDPNDITVNYTLNRTTRTVAVAIEADIGHALFADILYGFEGPGRVRSESAVEGGGPMSVVLAIDTSDSMGGTLDGQPPQSPTETRMHIVRQAANEMVSILQPNTLDPIKIGLVPWAHTACTVQHDCASTDGQITLALSTDDQSVSQAINALVVKGRGTRSTFGILGAKALLDGAPAEHHKVLVLLTDGDDRMCLGSNGRTHNCAPSAARLEQRAACTAAKNAGIEIFVIAAMKPIFVSGTHETALRECSSEGDRAGTHVFVNNATPQALETAFTSVALQLQKTRRVY